MTGANALRLIRLPGEKEMWLGPKRLGAEGWESGSTRTASKHRDQAAVDEESGRSYPAALGLTSDDP